MRWCDLGSDFLIENRNGPERETNDRVHSECPKFVVF
jgi:hypothetical protein